MILILFFPYFYHLYFISLSICFPFVRIFYKIEMKNIYNWIIKSRIVKMTADLLTTHCHSLKTGKSINLCSNTAKYLQQVKLVIVKYCSQHYQINRDFFFLAKCRTPVQSLSLIIWSLPLGMKTLDYVSLLSCFLEGMAI